MLSFYLNSVSHSSKLSHPRRGVTGTLIYSWSVRNTDDNLDLELASEVGVGEQSRGLSP